MTNKNERLQVLEMIESGVITPEEGARLLAAMEDPALPEEPVDYFSSEPDEFTPPLLTEPGNFADPFPEERSNGVGPDEVPVDPGLQHWRRWWMIPMWVGIGITVVGGLLMFLAYQASGMGFWFGCAWLPFLLGVGVMALAWGSRTSRWLHLRIQQKPGERPETIVLSFPLPLRFTAWAIRTFGHFIPQLHKTGIDEMILALGKTTGPENPFYIEVDEGEDGERVQIYIG